MEMFGENKFKNDDDVIYRCGNCGYESKEIFSKCPECGFEDIREIKNDIVNEEKNLSGKGVIKIVVKEPKTKEEKFEESKKSVGGGHIVVEEEPLETKVIKESKKKLFEITNKDIDDFFNEPPTEAKKIISKPELEKKESEEVKKPIDNIFGLIQDEISRLKSGEIGDKQKKYLKNQIKSILKEYLSREFENLKNIEDIRLLRGDWLRSSKQKIFQTMMLELKERILLKYGYPSDIMEIFRGAANEIEIDEIKRENKI